MQDIAMDKAMVSQRLSHVCTQLISSPSSLPSFWRPYSTVSQPSSPSNVAKRLISCGLGFYSILFIATLFILYHNPCRRQKFTLFTNCLLYALTTAVRCSQFPSSSGAIESQPSVSIGQHNSCEQSLPSPVTAEPPQEELKHTSPICLTLSTSSHLSLWVYI
jgi:hypothetical protein